MASEGKRGMTPDDLFSLKTVTDPRISPDGTRVAYVLSWNDRETDEVRSSIYVAPLDGSTAARRFTHGNKDSSPRWSPDRLHLAFVSNRGAENQIFLAPLDGGEARQLTKAKYGVSEPAWSPDSRRIAYVARTGDWKDPKDRKPTEHNAPRVLRNLTHKLDGTGFFDDRRSHVFVVDLDAGTETQITAGDWSDTSPAWSPDGELIAFVGDRDRRRFQRFGRADVWAVAATGGKPHKLTRGRGGASLPEFSPDGRWVAFVGHEYGDEVFARNAHLLIVPTAGGDPPRSLSAPLDRSPVGGPNPFGCTFRWSGDSGSILFLAGDRGRQALYRAGTANGSASRVLGGERLIQAFDVAADGTNVAFAAAWLDSPTEVYAASLAGVQERNLSQANQDLLKSADLGRVEALSYKADDGLEIETFVVYPPGYERGRQYPCVLQIHGGPHGAHPASFLLPVQVLAGAGYAVLLPNPRGSGSYGEKFAQACVRDWGGGDFRDLMRCVDEMVRRGIAATDRLYVGGYSYGGYMTSWTVGHTDRFRAAVVGAPVSDLISFFGTTDIPVFARNEIGGWPWEEAEAFRLHSPVTYLANCRTPVLLVHREGDLRCPIAQSEEIFQALRALGRKVEFVRYPGGSHGVATPSQLVDQMSRSTAWYNAHPAGERKPGRSRRLRQESLTSP